MAITEQQVIEKLRQVMDPHTGSNVYEMGLIKDLIVEPNRLSLRPDRRLKPPPAYRIELRMNLRQREQNPRTPSIGNGAVLEPGERR